MKRPLSVAAFAFSVIIPVALTQTSAPVPAVAPRPADKSESACSLSVNGAGETLIEPGMTVVFDAHLFVAAVDKAATPTVAITDSNDVVQRWPLKVIVVTQPDADPMRRLRWTLDADSTRTLASGKYLATIALTQGGQTLVASAPAVVNVVPAGSEKLNTDERSRVRLRYAASIGDAKGVEETARAWLAGNPRSVEALVALADVSAEAGQLETALDYVQRALGLVVANRASKPPRGLLRRQAAIASAILEKSPPKSTAPVPAPKKAP
jgi:hypothetical protein